MLELLLVVVLLVLLVAMIGAPLRSGRASSREAAESGERERLEAAKEAKYREFRDAELDYQTGKLSESDWQEMSGRLRTRAACLMRQLDADGYRKRMRFTRIHDEGFEWDWSRSQDGTESRCKSSAPRAPARRMRASCSCTAIPAELRRRSWTLTPALAAQADYLMVMADSHRQALESHFPQCGTVPRLLDPEGEDIADPIGGDREVYQECAAQIRRHLERFVGAVQH